MATPPEDDVAGTYTYFDLARLFNLTDVTFRSRLHRKQLDISSLRIICEQWLEQGGPILKLYKKGPRQ